MFFSSENKTFFQLSVSYCLVLSCELQTGNFVPLKEARSLKTFCVLKTLLSQMPSIGYQTAVGTSNKLQLEDRPVS